MLLQTSRVCTLYPVNFDVLKKMLKEYSTINKTFLIELVKLKS